jgi:hypothetical protein
MGLTLNGDWSNAHRGDTLTATNTLSVISDVRYDIYAKNSASDGRMKTSIATTKSLSNALLVLFTGTSISFNPNPKKVVNNALITTGTDYLIDYSQVIATTDSFCTATDPYTITITWGFTSSI